MKPPYYLTAYGIACKHGYTGTEKEWLKSLTAYGIAVDNGFEGNEEEWLISLTAFYLAQQAGYAGTIEEWMKLLNDPVPELTIGTVETLEGGSMATAKITGDKKKPVLNLGIPRGVGMADALPKVGGDMQGDINMAGYGIGNVRTPEKAGDAANKNYVDAVKRTAEDALPKKGGAMKGNVDMAGWRITGLPDPEDEGQAVTKRAMDAAVKSMNDLAAGKCSASAAVLVLTVSGWADNEQTVAALGVTADEDKCHVLASPAEESRVAYNDAVVRCTGQGDGTVTFAADEVPASDLTVCVLVIMEGESEEENK